VATYCFAVLSHHLLQKSAEKQTQ